MGEQAEVEHWARRYAVSAGPGSEHVGALLDRLDETRAQLSLQAPVVEAARRLVEHIEVAKASTRLDGEHYTRHYELQDQLSAAVRELDQPEVGG